jgi:hypothetical protein
MMAYRPKGKRSLGRPLKRWRETVTGHWGLILVRKKKIKLHVKELNIILLIYIISLRFV